MQKKLSRTVDRLPPVGMRNIKTVIAVFLCLLFFDTAQWGDSFYGTIAAVICMKPTTQGTVKAGLERFLGTCLGGLTGLAAMCVLESIGHGHRLWLIPLLVMALIYLCTCFSWTDSISIACVVLLSTLIMHKPEGMLSYQYVLRRIVETLIGVGIAYAVNALFFYCAKNKADISK